MTFDESFIVSEREKLEKELTSTLLRGVSRSFYLTLKALPGEICGPISLAYLLARASDTIADCGQMEKERREHFLQRLRVSLSQGAERDFFDDMGKTVPTMQLEKMEQELLCKLEKCFQWFTSFPQEEKQLMETVLGHILQGQLLDVKRFGCPSGVVALETEEDLEEYIYLVAGSVGEFWNALCFLRVKDYATGEEKRMREWAVAYGKGLQLINILRDIGKDLAICRCYLPCGELFSQGDGEALPQFSALLAFSIKWRNRCWEYLEQGLHYVDAIQSKRIRYATALPLLLAVRTLVLLESAEEEALREGVKISRGEVKTIMAKAMMANLRREGIKTLFHELKKGRKGGGISA